MSDALPQIALAAATKVLRPLIKILLRYGLTYAAFSDLAKQIYFEVAKTEFAIPGKRQTSSRISTMTGLSRKEVARLEALPEPDTELDISGINRAARVISGWVRDENFNNADGTPADLPFDEGEYSFTELVKRYSGDITARTIADELTRTGAITLTATGLIHLATRAYIPKTNETEKLTLLGSDVTDLIQTIDYNLIHTEQRRLQRKVAYNYIPVEKLPSLKSDLTNIAQTSLEAMDKLLAKHAIKKRSAKKGQQLARLGVGIYYFEEDHRG